jgi:hypothetical protein
LEWVGHVALLAVLLLGIWAIEMLTKRLWPEDTVLFRCVRLSDVFTAADSFVLIGVLYLGIYKTLKAYGIR